MNKEFVYFDKKIMVSDEKGDLSEPINYYDNLPKKLKLENEIEMLDNQITEDNAKLTQVKKIRKKHPTIALLLYLLASQIACAFVILALSNFNINDFINICNSKIPNNINFYEIMALSTSVMTMPIGLISFVKGNIINKNKEKDIKKLKEDIENNTNKLHEALKEIKKLEEDKTFKKFYYYDYDVVDVETRDIIKGKYKTLKRK